MSQEGRRPLLLRFFSGTQHQVGNVDVSGLGNRVQNRIGNDIRCKPCVLIEFFYHSLGLEGAIVFRSSVLTAPG